MLGIEPRIFSYFSKARKLAQMQRRLRLCVANTGG